MRPRSAAATLLTSLYMSGCASLAATEPTIPRDALLAVSNHSNIAICRVSAVRPGGGARFELLPKDTRIAPWRSVEVPAPVGLWDVELLDCESHLLTARRGVRIEREYRISFRAIEIDRRDRWQRRHLA